MPVRKSPKPIKKEVETFDNDKVYAKAKQYLDMKDTIKVATKTADEIKPTLVSVAEKSGTVLDSGTQYLEVICEGKPTIILQNICKTSMIPKSNVQNIIKEKFPHWEKELLETTTIFRADRLEQMVETGEITHAQAKLLLIEKTSYAFTPKYLKKEK